MAAPEICPHCGAEVPPKARACPECGSCPETGWSEKAGEERLGLPDDEFDYDGFVKEEFGGGGTRPRGIGAIWWVVAILVAGLILLLALH